MNRVLVLGGGPNGLAAAAVLARAGREVLVLEQAPSIGGLGGGREFHSGFKVPGLLHDDEGVPSVLVRELGLEAHGLSTRCRPRDVLAIAGGGPGLLLSADSNAIGTELDAQAKGDAAAWREWQALRSRIRPLMRRFLDGPPPPPSLSQGGGIWGLLGTGLAIRRLGRRTLQELARMGPSCVADCLRERFSGDLVQAALAAPALYGSWCGPWSPGTGAAFLLREAAAGPGIVGGTAALVGALEAACRVAGVEVRTNAAVGSLEVSGDMVAGAVLEDGEVLEGEVLATCDPRWLGGLLPQGVLPPAAARELRAVRGRGTTAKLHLAVDGLPEVAGRDDLPEVIRIGGHLDELEQAFDPVKYRSLPEKPMLEVRVPSLENPSLAPEGAHVVSVLVHHVPWDLDGGWNDAARTQLQKATFDRLEENLPGLNSRVRAAETLVPPDLDAAFGLVEGHIHHGEMALDQILSFRPTPSLSGFATPVEGLWLGGSGSHPGGGMPGAAGRLAAKKLLQSRPVE
jgi:phytoene dehydrogenase-like protein